MAKEIFASVASLLAAVWVTAFVHHLLPDPTKEWWGFPFFLTTVVFCVTAFASPMIYFNNKDRRRG